MLVRYAMLVVDGYSELDVGGRQRRNEASEGVFGRDRQPSLLAKKGDYWLSVGLSSERRLV